MIEQQEIDGRKALVSYFNDKMAPVDKVKATLVKVIFEDGHILFLKPKKDK